MFDDLRMKLARLIARKSDPTFGIAMRQRKGQAQWTERRFDKYAEEAYRKNVIAYQCINKVSDAVATIPLCLFKGDTEIDDPKHPLLALLKRPSPGVSGHAYRRNWAGYFQIAGNAYQLGIGPGTANPKGMQPVTLGPGKPPIELHLERPDRIKIIPGELGIAGYRYEFGGVTKDWEADEVTGESDILHTKTFNPLSELYGMSPVEAAIYAVDQHNAGSEWNFNLVKNSAAPSGILSVEGNLSDAQYDRLKQEMEHRHSGPKGAGRFMLGEGGMTWQGLGFSPKEMDWIKGQDVTAKMICLTFKVPPLLMNVGDDSTFANYAEANVALYRDAAIPLLQLLLDEWNHWLVPMFGDGIELRMNLDNVAALEPVRAAKWDAVQKAGWLTTNEKREATGYELIDDPNGDEILVPTTMGLLSKVGQDPVGDTGSVSDPASAAYDPTHPDYKPEHDASKPEYDPKKDPTKKPGFKPPGAVLAPGDKPDPKVDPKDATAKEKRMMLAALLRDGYDVKNAKNLVRDAFPEEE